jgi:hypothetical protein
MIRGNAGRVFELIITGTYLYRKFTDNNEVLIKGNYLSRQQFVNCNFVKQKDKNANHNH